MLHKYQANERIIFWDENAQEMEIPRYLSMLTRNLGRLWWVGSAWWVEAKSSHLLLWYATSRGKRYCEGCTETDPCVRFASHIEYWSTEYERRAEQAERVAKEREKRAKNPFNNHSRPAVHLDTTWKSQNAAKVLGLPWPCTREQLKKAFRDAVVKHHPDLGGSDVKMRSMIEAREILEKTL